MFKIEFTSSYNSKFDTMDQVYNEISEKTGIDKESLMVAQRRKDATPNYYSIYFMCNMGELGDKFLEYVANKTYDEKFTTRVEKVATLKTLIPENMKVKEAKEDVVNVHIPSNDLFSVKNTLLLEDSCTNALQDELNKGWRIIAVIPRAGQRRPDYILGM